MARNTGLLPKLNDKSQSCKHEEVSFLEEDNHFVCLECGFVPNDYALMDKNIPPLKWTQVGKGSSLPTFMSLYAFDDNIAHAHDWDLDLLERVCGNFFIPTCIEQDVRYRLDTEAYKKKRNGRRERSLSLMAFALYSSCLEADCVKLPEQVTSWFQVSLKRFWDVHKEFNYCQRKILPGDILNMIKGEVSLIDPTLSYKNYTDIASISNELASSTCNSPSVVLAACLYIYLSDKRKKKIAVRPIAKLCNVSCTSVNHLRKKLNFQDLFCSLKMQPGQKEGKDEEEEEEEGEEEAETCGQTA